MVKLFFYGIIGLIGLGLFIAILPILLYIVGFFAMIFFLGAIAKIVTG